MHRTTTTAALLATVAVSALSGCVTVQRPPTSGPPPGTAPSQTSASRPDGSTRPRIVQAPAREALEMVGPSRRPGRPAAPTPHRPPAPPVPRQQPPRVTRPQPPRKPPEQPRGKIPGASKSVPDSAPRSLPKNPDVCALGKQYGGWRPGSPEAVICDQAYGH
ncbi:hypothetical protein ABZ915_16335 [Streptomyces sp. NPDC046915]|uniref:hypothetical protein n=1 Tax=Streptomyces sp. NPDC046915 TaxID=3155257 RepID=UPI0033C9D8A1